MSTEPATDLHGLLSDAGVRLKSYRPGHNEKLRCPKCQGGRTKEASFSVTVDRDGEGFTAKCHRGKCGHTDGGRVRHTDGRPTKAPPREERVIVKPTPATQEPRPPSLYAFFDKRGIGPETVDAFRVYLGSHWFPARGDQDGPKEQWFPAKEYPALVFPYRWRGELVNRKYRPPHKDPQQQDKNALPTLFNIDAIDEESPDTVWWVEGEPDTMAMHEVGYVLTVSLKDGAPDKLRAEDDPTRQDDKRFAALATHADLLEKVKKFVLCGDMDEPGKVLREELARRLGRHRCWLVDWPEGCKDANDTLKQHGPRAVMDALLGERPYPIEGLQNIGRGTLTALRKRGAPAVMTTGTTSTDRILKLPTEGRLIVITGVPNGGKTPWLRFVMMHLMSEHKRRFAMFSPEMHPWEEFVASCAEVLKGKAFWPASHLEPSQVLTEGEIADAEEWLSTRLTMLASDVEDEPKSIDWLLDHAHTCVLRHGITDLGVDPWNEMEHVRGGVTEAEYTNRSLQRMRSFAERYGVNVWLIAHPSKLTAIRGAGGKMVLPVPGPYDINGGAAWANKPHIGLTVHRTAADTEIHLWKARQPRWGRKGTMAKLEFDVTTGRYQSAIIMPGSKSPPATEEEVLI